jgi:hypothetical protein
MLIVMTCSKPTISLTEFKIRVEGGASLSLASLPTKVSAIVRRASLLLVMSSNMY